MRIYREYSYPCLKTIVDTKSHSDCFLHYLVRFAYSRTETPANAFTVTSQNEKTSLLGKTKQDYASIVRWMSYANQEILPALGGWFRPLIGLDPYNKKNVHDSSENALKAVSVLNEHLLVHTFLVGERMTLADLFAAGIVSRGFEFFFDKQWREQNPNVTRWYETICNQPIYSAVAGKLQFIDEAIKNQAPKTEKQEKPKKEQAPKAASKPKAKEVDEEGEEEDKPAPKSKHPLEALPKPTLALDEWKRTYSNEDTREKALPWFWENFNSEEYSLWKCDYKYNDELTQTFMTANLIGMFPLFSLASLCVCTRGKVFNWIPLTGGFFARLEASRKYIFGCASVYGVKNDSVVQGAFIVRGQEAGPAFDVAPDYDSYSFTKLDPTKDKEFINAQWSWDKPIVVGGKSYEWADGKVFK